ncbi:MAG: hypothetical protein WBK19_15445 [Azonexus sp.]
MNIKELSTAKIAVAPYNDISIALVKSLPDSITFVGYADSFKDGDGVYRPDTVPDFDFIIVNSPNYWQQIAENYPADKVFLYKKHGMELVALKEYQLLLAENRFYDVLLLPFNKSNITDLAIVSRELSKIGITSALVDAGSEFDDNLKKGIACNPDVTFIGKDQVASTVRRALVASIDWDSAFGRPLLQAERAAGGLTIGIIDGIEDFEDADYDYERNAYNTVEYVLLMGSDDQKYLDHKREQTSIIGLPKMFDFYHETKYRPPRPKVMLNVNFTYGTFEEVRAAWVDDAIAACREANLDFIISQHHADHGDFAPELVSKKNVYDTIRESSIVVSRFSTVILESLALGKQVIYYNPHGETVSLYKNPQGAYRIATNRQDLLACLTAAAADPEFGRAAARQFLDRKCNVSSTVPPGKLAAYRIRNLLDERASIDFSPRKNFAIDPRYAARIAYHHYDDQSAEDEWQLEVYLHALGWLIKNNWQSVADFGCGSGFKLMTYLKQYETLGYELEVNFNVLRDRYPDREWRVSDLSRENDIDCDVLICSDVIEHLVDPDQLIDYFKNQSFKVLLISTPVRELVYAADDPARFGPPRNYAHQREWGFDEFRRYIEQSFDVLDHRITNHHQATQLIVCAKG